MMLADMQRARVLGWELPTAGWDVEVLTPASSEVRQDAVEPDGDGFFSDAPVHEVGSIGRRLFEAIGSRSLGWRTLLPMYRAGIALLATRRFDLVYFSTTTFCYFVLGPLWRQKFGIPYVLDFQDPWVKSDNSAYQNKSWKMLAREFLDRHMERFSVIRAAGIVSVSPGYIDQLRSRYQNYDPVCLSPERHRIIPFGVRQGDLFEAQKGLLLKQPRTKEQFTIHYIGVGGPAQRRSFTLVCRTIAKLRAEGNPLVNSVRIHLYGTMYGWRPGDPKDLEIVARDAGLGDIVEEHTERIPYRRSLELLLDGGGALVLGVTDPAYIPSKLFPYALSGKPLIAALRRGGSAYLEFQRSPGLGHVLWFDSSEDMPMERATDIMKKFLSEVFDRKTFDRARIIAPNLSAKMSREHTELFDVCI
jgi:hypothetical protein